MEYDPTEVTAVVSTRKFDAKYGPWAYIGSERRQQLSTASFSDYGKVLVK